MRKIAFISIEDEPIKKVMIHKSDANSYYIFGYDTIFESACKFDSFCSNLDDAEEFCSEAYNIEPKDWIMISELHTHCQQDYIMPVRVKGRDIGKPEWGHFELLSNGKWIEFLGVDKTQSLNGMTVNERLFLTGLMDEFDSAKLNDKEKAIKILEALTVDSLSIERILQE